MHPQAGGVEGAAPAPAPPLVQAIEAAQGHLLSIQNEDGHWCGELEGDTILESEYALLLWFLGRSGEERVAKAGAYLRDNQLPEGGWAIYPGGPAEASASVKAYFVLKLLGDDPEAPHMRRAREAILAAGGIEATNSFTKIYLAIFGQYDWWRCPAVPPEMIFLPRWFYFNIYAMSSWSRAIVVPLSIIWAMKPSCEVPRESGIEELYVPDARPARSAASRRHRMWSKFFSALNRVLLAVEASGVTPLRRRALARAEAWIRARLDDSDGLGAIFPPIVNTVLALRALGFPADDPVVRSQVAELERLEIEEEGTLRLQPCKSPVWDTALATTVLAVSGLPGDHPALLKASRWLLDREVRKLGDWSFACPGVEPGGWYFEYANEFYPDCDDTGQVLTALSRIWLPPEEEPRRHDAVRRGLAWLLAMQNRDGGWAAFDRGCSRRILTYIPFADHNAMIDPSSADITGRTLECLADLGFDATHPAVARAVGFLLARQEDDGSWYGRWGCNYLYGTWLALQGLARHGDIAGEPWCLRAAEWIRGCQNPDGGWGESPRSYDEPGTKGQGESTAAQTGWALLGLFAAGDFTSGSVQRGVEHLLATQREDGSWKDEPWTATGFPRVFYLRYHLYATYFPLLALAAYERRDPGAGRSRWEAA